MYSPRELLLKRTLDVAVAGAGLVTMAPVLATIGLLVKLSSPGPVLFRQTRVGRGGRPFEMIKFRTMRVANSGPEVTASGDSRITTVGRLLRKSKLDELPELVNVLKGDLSLVGPRPEVPRYVALYPAEERDFLQRFRPGLTDPATIRFRNEEELLAQAPDPERYYREQILTEKLRMYVDYLRSASLVSDLRVLVDTARAIVSSKDK